MKLYLTKENSKVYHEIDGHAIFDIWISDCNRVFNETEVTEGRPRGKRRCRNCERAGRVEIGTAK